MKISRKMIPPSILPPRRLRKKKIAIVASRFNGVITRRLVHSAEEVLSEKGIKKINLLIQWTAGAFETPLACLRLARTRRFDGLVAIGCVIRGQTDHYRHIARESIRGVMEVMLKTGIPIGLGILTTSTEREALERAGGSHGDKGREAALACLEMISLFG